MTIFSNKIAFFSPLYHAYCVKEHIKRIYGQGNKNIQAYIAPHVRRARRCRLSGAAVMG